MLFWSNLRELPPCLVRRAPGKAVGFQMAGGFAVSGVRAGRELMAAQKCAAPLSFLYSHQYLLCPCEKLRAL